MRKNKHSTNGKIWIPPFGFYFEGLLASDSGDTQQALIIRSPDDGHYLWLYIFLLSPADDYKTVFYPQEPIRFDGLVAAMKHLGFDYQQASWSQIKKDQKTLLTILDSVREENAPTDHKIEFLYPLRRSHPVF
ncbi:MAG: hypothetical protein HY052_08570 [Proteobacteria bacterium]|nr:hypothetical protein [Pseudomonadota bacterium]